MRTGGISLKFVFGCPLLLGYPLLDFYSGDGVFCPMDKRSPVEQFAEEAVFITWRPPAAPVGMVLPKRFWRWIPTRPSRSAKI